MATLLIHFISDFLRDEALRCSVMEDEDAAYAKYGLSPEQQALLQRVRDGDATRDDLLKAIADEIGPIRFEPGAGALTYPAGDVIIHRHQVSSVGDARTVELVGVGFASGSTVTFTAGDGTSTPGVVTKRTCDVDVWQRLTVTVTLPPGGYTMTITRPEGTANSKPVTFP